MRADEDLARAIRQHHVEQRAGEGLFIDMRVHEFARRQQIVGTVEDFPAIGVVIPAGVEMFEGYVDSPAHADTVRRGGNDLWRARGCGAGEEREAKSCLESAEHATLITRERREKKLNSSCMGQS